MARRPCLRCYWAASKPPSQRIRQPASRLCPATRPPASACLVAPGQAQPAVWGEVSDVYESLALIPQQLEGHWVRHFERQFFKRKRSPAAAAAQQQGWHAGNVAARSGAWLLPSTAEDSTAQHSTAQHSTKDTSAADFNTHWSNWKSTRRLGRAGGWVDDLPMIPKGRPSPERGVKPGSGRRSVLASASTCGGSRDRQGGGRRHQQWSLTADPCLLHSACPAKPTCPASQPASRPASHSP